MGLIFSLFDFASSRKVPFGIPQYVQCMHHGLTFVLLCVPFLFADQRIPHQRVPQPCFESAVAIL